MDLVSSKLAMMAAAIIKEVERSVVVTQVCNFGLFILGLVGQVIHIKTKVDWKSILTMFELYSPQRVYMHSN